LDRSPATAAARRTATAAWRWSAAPPGLAMGCVWYRSKPTPLRFLLPPALAPGRFAPQINRLVALVVAQAPHFAAVGGQEERGGAPLGWEGEMAPTAGQGGALHLLLGGRRGVAPTGDEREVRGRVMWRGCLEEGPLQRGWRAVRLSAPGDATGRRPPVHFYRQNPRSGQLER
jgi:hypothetical protein